MKDLQLYIKQPYLDEVNVAAGSTTNRTNYSNDFNASTPGGAAWIKSGTTTTFTTVGAGGYTVTDAFGNTGAWEITSVPVPYNGASVYQTGSHTVGTYTLSVYVKSASGQEERFKLFYLRYGSQVKSDEVFIADNQWRRYTFTFTEASNIGGIGLGAEDSYKTFNLYLGQFQFETGSVANDYVETNLGYTTNTLPAQYTYKPWGKIDLFEDESIELTDSIQDIRDISKVFTAFTKQFKIPATKNNNKIFKHYYNPSIDGFDARIKVDARINMGGATFKDGQIELKGATTKLGKPVHYSIVFYGRTVELKDILGEDKIDQLYGTSLDNLNFPYSSSNVETGLTTGLIYDSGSGNMIANTGSDSGDVCFPFISSKNYYYTDKSDTVNLDPEAFSSNIELRNVHKSTNGDSSHGLLWTDLKPSVRITKILDAIQEKYNLTFSNNFFNNTENTYLNDLYLWCHNKAGTIEDQIDKDEVRLEIRKSNGDFGTNLTGGVEQRVNEPWDSSDSSLGLFKCTTTGSGQGRKRRYPRIAFTVNTPSSTDEYYIRVVKDVYSSNGTVTREAVQVTQTDIQVGTQSFSFDVINGEHYNNWVDVKIYVTSFASLSSFTISSYNISTVERSFSGTTSVVQTGNYSYNYGYATSVTMPGGKFNIASNLPDIKVIDFLTSLFKMFNLTAYFNGNELVIRTLEDYYAEGSRKNLSKYVEVGVVNINKSQNYKSIDFSTDGSETYLIKKANQEGNRDFGNLSYNLAEDVNTNITGKPYKLEIDFDKMMYEKMSDQDDKSVVTNTTWGWAVGDSASPELTKPLLHYAIRTNTPAAAENLHFVESKPSEPGGYSYVEIDEFIRPSNTTEDGYFSIHFQQEIDEYTLETSKENLFTFYYSDYIAGVFDKNSRLFSYEGYLPSNVLLDLKLNDSVVIGNREFVINKMNTNLSTGKTKLSLSNAVVYRSGVVTPITASPDVTAPIITLNGDAVVNISPADTYVDAGATAYDGTDGDVTGSIVTVNNVVSGTVGSYTVTYNVSDAAGNNATEVTRIVNIADNIPPVITLSGDNPLTIQYTDTYVEPGYTATDDVDGNVTGDVIVTTVGNMGTDGDYYIGEFKKVYTVQDAAGNVGIAERTVIVEDSVPPVITLSGITLQYIEYNEDWSEDGYQAVDGREGWLTNDVVVTDNIVYKEPGIIQVGTYTISYNVTDSSGNAAVTKTRTIVVRDTTDPVITMLGANPHHVQQGDLYTQQGAIALDEYDGGLSPDITYTTNLDMNTLGTYTQTYSVSDSSGNTDTAVRTIVVEADLTPPSFPTVGDAINLIAGMNGSTVGTFQLNAVDNVGVTSFLFKMNGITKYLGAPTAGTPGSNQQHEVFVTGIPTGDYVTFELTATDAAGNSSKTTRIIDNS